MFPVIGVTGSHREIRTVPGTDPAVAVQRAYTDMVYAGGGIPVVLAPTEPDTTSAILERIDALVLSGGGDVDPRLYDGEDHPAVSGVDRERDDFEIALVHGAMALGMPTLVICRGAQLVNVALGGSLVEDVPTMVANEEGHDRRGPEARLAVQHVEVAPGSGTARALGCTRLIVNSIHHQAVRAPAPGVRVTARAADGVVEAFEAEDWPLIVVQWHPEYLGPTDGPSLRLFEDLVESARAWRPNRVG